MSYSWSQFPQEPTRQYTFNPSVELSQQPFPGHPYTVESELVDGTGPEGMDPLTTDLPAADDVDLLDFVLRYDMPTLLCS